jgi:hypothetical protein
VVFAWRRPEDFNCEICALKPNLKLIKGCTTPSQHPWIFPPMDHDCVDHLELWTCPVNHLHTDVALAFRQFHMAGKIAALSEQDDLCPPYLDALHAIAHELGEVELYNARRAAQAAKNR